MSNCYYIAGVSFITFLIPTLQFLGCQERDKSCPYECCIVRKPYFKRCQFFLSTKPLLKNVRVTNKGEWGENCLLD